MTEGEGRVGELPPEIFPFKEEIRTFVTRDGRRLRDVTFGEKFLDQQEEWWKGRYGDKVPREWLTDPWGIEKYIRRHSRKQLRENESLLEAIVACPLTIHPFCDLAEKIPLSARLLAVGFVNSLSEQPRIKEGILERQRKMGVSNETLEEAQRLAAQWESQQQSFKI